MAMKEAGSDDLYALGKSLKISGYSFHIYKRELVVLSLKKKTHTHTLFFKVKLDKVLTLSAVVPYLSDSKTPLATGNHLVPLVMQHIHKPVGLVLTDQLRYVGSQRRVGGQPDAVS